LVLELVLEAALAAALAEPRAEQAGAKTEQVEEADSEPIAHFLLAGMIKVTNLRAKSTP
jgi:hypothetical protein